METIYLQIYANNNGHCYATHFVLVKIKFKNKTFKYYYIIHLVMLWSSSKTLNNKKNQ